MTEYVESNLHFHFSPKWAVKKYDAHRFFQGLAGAGLKGVDFIATDGQRLLLCEVKNYRRRQAWQHENPVDAIMAQPEVFALEMGQKVVDTLRGISIIGQYYHRKWIFRLLRPLLLRLAPNGQDWRFWAHACHLIQTSENISFMLWLETEAPQFRLAQSVETALRRQLVGRVEAIFVAHNNHQPLQDEISVRPE